MFEIVALFASAYRPLWDKSRSSYQQSARYPPDQTVGAVPLETNRDDREERGNDPLTAGREL